MPPVPRPSLPAVACVLVLAAPVAACSGVGDARLDAVDGCADVQVVGIRGQSQSLEDNRGLGREVDQVTRALERGLADEDVEVTALQHRSRDTDDADVYDADVEAGREELADVLDTLTGECPDATLVVVGFSQGAQVAQETLAASGRLAARVDALGLVGSPRHDPDSGATAVDLPGPPAQRAGVLGAGPDLGDLTARTVEACLDRDAVCDADGSTDLTGHKTGYEDPAVGRAVARELLRVLRG